VTSDDDSVTAAKADLDYVAPVAGSTFTLTTGVDSISAGTGDDYIPGTIGGTDPTITAGDSIDGKDGSDTFAIISTGAAAATVAGVTLSNVEKVRISDSNTVGTTLNLAGATGVETLESFASSGAALTFSNVGEVATLALANTSGAGTVTLGYTTAASTGATTQAITLDNAAATGATTIAGVETVNISASSASSIVLAASSAAAVNVDTAVATGINLSNAANTALTTVTAGESTGAVTYTLNFNNVEMSVTGGAGKDIFDVTAGTYGLNDTLDGGEGEDTLRLQGTGDITDLGSVGATGATFSNIEALRLVAADDGGAGAADYTVDMDDAPSVVSITAASTDVNLASAVILNDLSATQAGAITLTAGAAGTTGITLTTDLKDGTGVADSATVTAATVTGFTTTIDDNGGNGAIEQLTLNMVGDHDHTIVIGAGDFAGSTLGQGSLTVTGGGAGRTMTFGTNAISADTIDLSGVVSDTVLTAATGVDHTITGGTGDDDVTFTTGLDGDDSIDLGEGNDRVIITPAAGMSLSPTITNVEELAIAASASVTLNVRSVTVPELILVAGNGINANVLTMANSTAVTNILATPTAAGANDDANGVTFTGAGYAGTDDTVTITGSTAAEQMTVGALTLNGVENINIVVGGDATEDTFTIGNLVNNAINTMTVTSSGFGETTTGTDIVLGSVGDGANGMSNFDASGADTGVSVTLADMAASSSVTGSAYRDAFILTGSAGGAIVSMGAGNDQATASAAGDTIYGEGGNDTLDGAAGADTLDGGAGSDIITGNGAADVITLGAGIDTVVRNGNGTTDGSDIINDFTPGAGGDIISFTTNNAVLNTGNTFEFLLDTANATGTNLTVADGLLAVDFAEVSDLATGTVLSFIQDFFGAGGTAELVFGNSDDEVYLLVDDGTDTGLYFLDASATDSSGTTVTLIATMSGTEVEDYTAANFANFI
jgi:hypothetical protein